MTARFRHGADSVLMVVCLAGVAGTALTGCKVTHQEKSSFSRTSQNSDHSPMDRTAMHDAHKSQHADAKGPHCPEDQRYEGQMPHRFENAEAWSKKFDDPARDEWQQPDKVLSFVGLQDGEALADVGAGTGYFTIRFAGATPGAKIYGVDIEPDMIKFMDERAANAGLRNVACLLADPDDPALVRPVDVIFLCDTYHHLSQRENYFRHAAEYLKIGGRVVVVDFKLGDFPVGPSNHHKLAPDGVIREMKAAGYQLQKQDTGTLPYQYMLSFVREN